MLGAPHPRDDRLTLVESRLPIAYDLACTGITAPNRVGYAQDFVTKAMCRLAIRSPTLTGGRADRRMDEGHM